jgi:sigma-E factor negative regulatory protein RseA
MNAEQIFSVQPSPGSAQMPQTDGQASMVGAWLDGELTEAELTAWLSQGVPSDAVVVRGQVYQLIGDALRGEAPLVAAEPSAFLLGVQARLRDEAPWRAPAAAPAPLRSTSAIEVAQVRAPAANDAVFRWKLVAGLASLAAVMAVSWTVLGTAPAGSGAGAAQPQLALAQPAPGERAAGLVIGAPVAVNTGQGVLIRDAGLEALMAEHRQHGGVSALQMPAGFLRNATHHSDAR